MAFKTKINYRAFTLIELIISITISILLMVSIWVFVTSSLSNLFYGQKEIKNIRDTNSFFREIYEIQRSIDWKNIYVWDDFILAKRDSIYDEGGFIYLWFEELEKFYCEEDSEDIKTNHIFTKNFIPFLESWENLWEESMYESNLVEFKWTKYKTLQKEHKVVSEDWEILIWRWVFWTNFREWTSGKDVYLNSPTWLATDWENLYIADTLNDRILYYDWDWVYTLLDEKDWLKEPTGLYYDTIEKSLYISNSAKWEILKLSSPIDSNPNNFNINFSWVEEQDTSMISLFFGRENEKQDITDLVNISNNDIYTNPNNQNERIENWLHYIFKEEITNSSGAVIWIGTKTINFSPTNNHFLTISWIPNFSESWNYYITLRIWNNYRKVFYYHTIWDEDLTTKNDNILEVYARDLNYPNAILWKDDYSEFNLDSVEKLEYNKKYDSILEVPIDNIDIDENDELINIIIDYYKDYSCYNLSENSNKKEKYIWKINTK